MTRRTKEQSQVVAGCERLSRSESRATADAVGILELKSPLTGLLRRDSTDVSPEIVNSDKNVEFC